MPWLRTVVARSVQAAGAIVAELQTSASFSDARMPPPFSIYVSGLGRHEMAQPR
jgi:hypothetical protein